MKVIGAMGDFSDRRPEVWPALTARLYQLHQLGDRTADVTEGTALDGKIFEAGGTFEFRVEPHGDGSRISVDYHRRSKALLGRCIGAMLQLTGGAPIKRSFRQVYGKPS